jgi:serine/threonine protein kinase
MTEEQVFLAALALADPAERNAYLEKACAGDAEFRAQVQDLLAAHFKTGDFLDEPVGVQMGAGSPRAINGNAGSRHANLEGIAGADEKSPDEPDELHFLQPSARTDSLGRLGHYEVLQILGKGGFGIVFQAFDEVLQRVVALKVLAQAIAATSPARKRFLREARSSAQIRHENVVQVYAVEEQPLPYLVMEFIPGETLQQRLDRTGPLEAPEIVRLGRQIAEGLAAAHATGVIHLDIKPCNVLIEGGPQGRVKITDFGLARAADDASLTQSGVLAGTPLYMAPEQAQGETLDHRADLFSLGSVLYVMATGRPPFRASTTFAVLKRVVEDNPRPIREVIPEIPQWLVDVIAKLLAKKPGDRFQSAREAADVLADCEAQFLNDLGQAVPGRPSVDPPEAAKDVRKPIDAPLAEHTAPGEAPVVKEVPQKLDSPGRWAHFTQQILRLCRRLAGGPESYRLAYLSLLVLSGAWLLMPRGRLDETVQGPVAATLVSFILARAALSLFGAHRLTGGQKWLLYPALVAVYLPVTAILLLGPVALCGLLAIKADDELKHERESLNSEIAYVNNLTEKDSKELREAETPGKAPSRPVGDIKSDLAKHASRKMSLVRELGTYPPHPIVAGAVLTPVVLILGLIAVAGATWFLIGLFCTLFPGAVRNIFYPFAGGFSRRMGFGLAVLGLLMTFGGLVVFR